MAMVGVWRGKNVVVPTMESPILLGAKFSRTVTPGEPITTVITLFCHFTSTVPVKCLDTHLYTSVNVTYCSIILCVYC